MIAGKSGNKSSQHNKNRFKKHINHDVTNRDAKIKCFNCGTIGHRAKNSKAFHVTGDILCNSWCFDSGCTSHMCKDIERFVKIDREYDRGKLNLASSACTDIRYKGIVSTVTNSNTGSRALNFFDTLYVPDLRTNLISISKITDKRHKVIFSKTKAEVIDHDHGNVLIIARRENGLYYFSRVTDDECRNVLEANVTRRVPKNSLEDSHIRMGHLNIQSLRKASRKRSIHEVNVKNMNQDFECSVCL